MPAPTALQRAPDKLAEDVAMTDVSNAPGYNDSSTIINPNAIDPSTATEAAPNINSTSAAQSSSVPLTSTSSTEPNLDLESRPVFPPATFTIVSAKKNTPQARQQKQHHHHQKRPSSQLPHTETRKIPIPPHRMTPLKASWPKIYPPLVEHLKLQVRMNLRLRAVELRTSRYHQHQHNTQNENLNNASTTTIVNSNNYSSSRTIYTPTEALQKGDDFLRAITLGFDVDDAIALLRLDDLYIETFEIRDVKPLHGEHLSRAIGRIAGQNGKTKFAIENASKTRIVLADSKIHILGGFKNIHVAREAVVSLILGSPPGKVYGNLRTVAGRMKERF